MLSDAFVIGEGLTLSAQQTKTDTYGNSVLSSEDKLTVTSLIVYTVQPSPF